MSEQLTLPHLFRKIDHNIMTDEDLFVSTVLVVDITANGLQSEIELKYFTICNFFIEFFESFRRFPRILS